MKKYNELRDEIISKVKDRTISCQNNRGVVFNISVEDELLIVGVEGDNKDDINSVSFGKVNNTYMTNRKETNTVVLKGNRDYIEESVVVLNKIKEIMENVKNFDKENKKLL